MAERFLMNERDAMMLSPLQLAYVGDSVWEILVRTRLIAQRKNVKHMHRECVDAVNAGAQARFAQVLLPLFSETEMSVFLRGRNAHPHHPSPRHQDRGDYAEATGFEAVMGFLYLTGQDDRVRRLEDAIWTEREGPRSEEG
ncbi:MAG: hypothetical protein IKE24_05005 [Clostridia bacterium]|nr:hypothetical protein [Clostridia bacterium]